MMKKIVLFGLLIASAVTLNSCGDGEGSDAESSTEAKTVDLLGHVEAVEMGQTPLVIAVGNYTDNYMSKDIKNLVGEGKKILQVEVYVENNGKSSIIVPPASFTLNNGKETIEVHNIISMKLDDHTLYDGNIGSTYKKGFLYYELNADANVENFKFNIRNTAYNDEHVGSIPLKQKTDFKAIAADAELLPTENTLVVEDLLYDGKGTLTIDKVTENYTAKEKNSHAPYTQYLKVEYTLSVEKGSLFCHSSNFKLKSRLLKEATFSRDDEVEGGTLKAGEQRKGYAVFEVPVGDSDYTLVYKMNSELKLK